ncbi:hypothetical protein BLA24_14650 [Streptomyces cinnamoneus]|uniref:Lipoprotein n=1 Tax=Streptomyces cinnamoneus TaxID=53446 RepID=A0A2G1XII5_STRCJ|nr:hypothetical protein [Streptomyces cinnamoneus]PHQ51020.1 hypothetical protein BLA24_14650 [Streptomyces cinnamoneus]PPT13757.1 hypothetical protein CYQ11_13420 [Streptomyces cinnamoneus]
MAAKKSAVRVAAVAAVALALTSVTGCGGGKSGGGGSSAAEGTQAPQGAREGGGAPGGESPAAMAISALRKAVDATDGKHSAKVDGSMAMGDMMSADLKGAFDWSQGMQGDVTMNYTGGQMGDLLKEMAGGGGMRALYLRDAYYASMGDEMSAKIGGKHWIKYDYDWMAQKMGPSGAYMKDQMQNNNPTRSARLVIESGDVRAAGTEDVRGVKATHYTGTVDVTKIAEKSSTLGKDAVDGLKRQLGQQGATTEQIDLWVSEDNLLIKKVERAQGSRGAVNSTVYYSDFGTSVTLSAPPASDTLDAARSAGAGAA